MKDKSTYTILGFVIVAIFWSGIAMLWYRSLIFRLIDDCTLRQSKTVLWALILGSIFLSTFVTCRYRKTSWGIVTSLAIPFGIYTILTYGKFITKKVNLLLIISGVLIFIYLLLVMCRKVKRKRSIGRVMKARGFKFLHGSQNIIGTAMLCLLASLLLPTFFSGTIFQPASVEAEKPAAGQEQTIENNMDTVLMLQEDVWKTMDIGEKLDILQMVANIEACELGLPHELNVVVEEMQDAVQQGYAQHGYYDDRTHEIYLNLDHVQFAPAEEVLKCVAHEAFHAFTHRFIELYNSTPDDMKKLMVFEKALIYAEEYSHYVDGSEDGSFPAYYAQECEKSAREWGDVRMREYQNKIAQYLDKQNAR